MSINKSLNTEMKHTIFDITVNHIKSKKSLLSLRNASHVMKQYEKLFYSDLKKEPSSSECKDFVEIIKNCDINEIEHYLDVFFTNSSTK